MSSSARQSFHLQQPNHKLTYTVDGSYQKVSSFILDNCRYLSEHKLPKDKHRHGNYGSIDIFYNSKTNNRIVVKTPMKLFRSDDVELIYDSKKEARYLEELYPDEGFYAFDLIDTKHDNLSSYAMFMPYFPDYDFTDAIRQSTSDVMVVCYFLAVAKELERIHQKQIIHNDVKSNNIRVDKKGKVHFIDFYFATKMTKDDVVYYDGTEADYIETYTAPELREEAEGSHKPTTHCDVYEFGCMIRSLYTMSNGWIEKSDKATWVPQTSFYPAYLLDFYQQSQSANMYARPKLSSFISMLTGWLNQPPPQEINFIFAQENFSNPCLLIGNKKYISTKEYKSNSKNNLIKVYNTDLGMLRIKFFEREMCTRDIDNIAYSKELYPEPVDAINKSHSLKKHPERPLICNYQFFSISRYSPGVSYDNYVKTISTDLQKIRLVLAVCLEVQRIHAAGYLHGNIKQENIIVNANNSNQLPIIKLYNFEWGNRLDEAYVKTTECDDSCGQHWPPERRDFRLFLPDVVQDHYQLSFVFDKQNPLNVKDAEFEKQLTEFVSKVRTIHPKHRKGCLENLIEWLKNAEPRFAIEERDSVMTELSNALLPSIYKFFGS